MKNFRRAIRDSWHFWPSIVLATVCSVGVAALWGGNIGALWPVIELTLRGESSQSWFESEIQQLDEKIVQAQTRLNALPADGDAQTAESARAIGEEIQSHESKRAWQQWGLDLANRFLPTDPFKTICVIMGFLICSTMVRHVLLLTNEMLIAHVSTSIVRSLRLRVFDRGLKLDRKAYGDYGTSGLMANVTMTADALSVGLMNFFGAAVREPLRICSCLIGASLVCWRLLAISLVLAPFLVFLVHFFNQKLRGLGKQMLSRNTGFHETIMEALNNLFTVQAYTMEREERQRFEVVTKDMQKFSMGLTFYSSLSKPFTELIGVGMIAVTVCAGSYLIVNDATHIFNVRVCTDPLTISQLLVFFGLLVGASDPLRKLSGVFTSIYLGGVAADNIYGLLDHPDAVSERETTITIDRPHGELRIRDVSFHYDKSHPVLRGVDLTLRRGDTVAIIGANGCGKSTLLQLLGRYYDPVEGVVEMDGVDFRDMATADIRQRVAVVSQSTELFNRSVLDNIRYGSPDRTEEDAIEAAKKAHAHDFITKSLADGYQTVVGQSGQRLSGGQRQRLALARAILRQPELLILDESTSQIDMSSELQIRAALDTMKGTMTILIVTHREALLAIADRTYEMKAGQLIPADRQLKRSA